MYHPTGKDPTGFTKCTWLADSTNSESIRGAILNIGFNCRLNDSSVAVQGETVSLEFMQKLVQCEITLWLSQYPEFSKEA